MLPAVIVFPGSNCERDVAVCLTAACGVPPLLVWHGERDLPQCDAIILPGGFSFGDYLRAGSMAAQSPIMREVAAAAKRGVPVLGICNGFQILIECGLLPGALMRNTRLQFICRNQRLRVERAILPFTGGYQSGQIISLPIAHNEGCYFADIDTRSALADNGQIIFTYVDDNPNGSCDDIAGIVNRGGNVLGMMPHPERAAERALGGVDGAPLFAALCSM